jgi:hypothetical protein
MTITRPGPFLILFVAAVIARGAPLERDLGHGLVYVRVHEVAELPTKTIPGRAPPCILDLRYVNADANAATACLAWLKQRSTTRSPVFVLANSETSNALRKALFGAERASGVVVVGLPGRNFQPDVAVKTSAETERDAYNALEQGTPVAKLLTDNPGKVRNDEASLSKDRLAEAAADAADDALTGKREPPPIDAALQRAVHLHRTLVALKKI